MWAMGWSKHEAIGCLHMFWWWCVDHAETGDLRRFNDAHLALSVELDKQDSGKFITAMVDAGFLEREPYFRVHNWWKYVRRFMQQRYKDNPARWREIQLLYTEEFLTGSVTGTVTGPVTGPVTGLVTQETNQPTYQPTNQPSAGARIVNSSEPISFTQFWQAYPRQERRLEALAVWRTLQMNLALEAEIMKSLACWKTSQDWRKDGGRYVPHPDKWLIGRRWTEKPRGYVDDFDARLQKTKQEMDGRK